MIHYNLQCDRGHAFDGWFKDSLSFEHQAKSALIACPSCDSSTVTRALMAPALARSARHAGNASPERAADKAAPSPAPAPSPTAAMTSHTVPDQLRVLLQRVRMEVEKHCDYVGKDFAEEARRIHYGETETRGIYGEASRDDAESLAEEGIEFGVLPWLPRTDS
ncbi:MAG: hypothetical protein B7Z81_15685 [Acidocella sp. 20-61-6]|nr:MAG: hypothetical protein B7Z81_15685 [Acidocella sp. 20-61-6]